MRWDGAWLSRQRPIIYGEVLNTHYAMPTFPTNSLALLINIFGRNNRKITNAPRRGKKKVTSNGS